MGQVGQRVELTVTEVRSTVRGVTVMVGYRDGVTEPLYKVGSPEFQYNVEEGEPPPAPGDKIVFVGGTRLDLCLAKVAPGEPIFVLRGQDSYAPVIVRCWVAEVLTGLGVTVGTWNGYPDARDLRAILERFEDDKVRRKLVEALDQADAMEAWPGRKAPD